MKARQNTHMLGQRQPREPDDRAVFRFEIAREALDSAMLRRDKSKVKAARAALNAAWQRLIAA